VGFYPSGGICSTPQQMRPPGTDTSGQNQALLGG
jgi:hypothetical protein